MTTEERAALTAEVTKQLAAVDAKNTAHWAAKFKADPKAFRAELADVTKRSYYNAGRYEDGTQACLIALVKAMHRGMAAAQEAA